MVGFGSIVPVVPCAFPAREGALINHCLPQCAVRFRPTRSWATRTGETACALPLREIATVRALAVCEVELFVSADGKGVVCGDPAGSIPE